MIIDIPGYCPACGQAKLYVSAVGGIAGPLHCLTHGCPDSGAAAKILSDPEIHHIVRFDPDTDIFNAQHPLRERIDGMLLDCAIHEEIHRWLDDDNPDEGTWRIKRRDDVEGEESNEWPYLWERIDAR